MLSVICHPEALLLREGSPGMVQSEAHLSGSHPEARFMAEEPGQSISIETLREILRAKKALQDDTPLTALLSPK